MKIEKAKEKDLAEINELTLRSKDYWKYGSEQIEKWKEELNISSRYLNSNQVYKCKQGEKMIGFYAYNSIDSIKVKLNFFFIDPEFIGKGYGMKLIKDCLKRMKDSGFEKVSVDSDPNAEAFYKRAGFKVIGKLKSSIKDRFLPIMEFDLMDH